MSWRKTHFDKALQSLSFWNKELQPLVQNPDILTTTISPVSAFLSSLLSSVTRRQPCCGTGICSSLKKKVILPGLGMTILTELVHQRIYKSKSKSACAVWTCHAAESQQSATTTAAITLEQPHHSRNIPQVKLPQSFPMAKVRPTTQIRSSWSCSQ